MEHRKRGWHWLVQPLKIKGLERGKRYSGQVRVIAIAWKNLQDPGRLSSPAYYEKGKEMHSAASIQLKKQHQHRQDKLLFGTEFETER